MLDSNPTKVPMLVIGGLRYLVHTRPNLAYSVIVSEFMEKPKIMNQNAAKRILRYLKGTMNLGLIYAANEDNNIVIGYSDSDLAGNMEDMKSTRGRVFSLIRSLITWNSQKQKCVELSSCKEEFMVATTASCQEVWVKETVVSNYRAQHTTNNFVYNSKSAIDLAKNPSFHGMSKHIDIRFHFIRECIENGDIVVKHIYT
ncbi:secreted RxLR effector protein 161-like [Apium graveolens]|uniref:secreted RxLR effector protein 161-like n=1 Tax=Apium graveolens TaxID=4045 RepID=UPI003D78BD0E